MQVPGALAEGTLFFFSVSPIKLGIASNTLIIKYLIRQCTLTPLSVALCATRYTILRVIVQLAWFLFADRNLSIFYKSSKGLLIFCMLFVVT